MDTNNTKRSNTVSMVTKINRLVAVALIASWLVISSVHVTESRDVSIETDVDRNDRVGQLNANDGQSEVAAATPEVKRYTAFRSDLGKRRPFRSDLGKRRSGFDENKRYATFRSDLGKRQSQTSREHMEPTFDQKESDPSRLLFDELVVRGNGADDDGLEFDAEKRYTAFRSDLGKRMGKSGELVIDNEFGSDLDTDNDDQSYSSFRLGVGPNHHIPLIAQKKAVSYFRSDLGKRFVGFRSDLGK